MASHFSRSVAPQWAQLSTKTSRIAPGFPLALRRPCPSQTRSLSASMHQRDSASGANNFDDFAKMMQKDRKKETQEAVASTVRNLKSQERPPGSSSSSSSSPSSSLPSTQNSSSTDRPRWSYTPEAMKAPFSPHIVKDPRRSVWIVNNNPKKLDDFYRRLLGPDGDHLLPEEVKWLAVTHKSFDQGRRGFNDRLAYFGRQAVLLEATRDIIATSLTTVDTLPPSEPDQYGRVPFTHPALSGLDHLNQQKPSDMLKFERVAKLAHDLGLPSVLRWKPRLPENLEGSGQSIVLNTTMHAIFGALLLQHGAETGNKLIRERLLRRLP